MKIEKLLRLDGISYKVDKTILLDDITFDIESNGSTCLLGKNGSGKSTLIDIITGDLRPTSGKIIYLSGKSIKANKTDISVLYDFIPFYPMLKVKETLHLFGLGYNQDYKNHSELMECLELHLFMDKLFSKLSRGERKKVALFVALFHNPKLLIMDEPMAELDPIIRENIWKTLIFKTNRTTFFTTHNWDEAQNYADTIIFLYKGKKIGMLSSEKKEAIKGKKIIISKQVNLPRLFLEQNNYYITDNQYFIFPKINQEKPLIEKVSSITSNYSVQDKKLEDVYQLLIPKNIA